MRILLRRVHLVASLAAGLWLAASGLSGVLLIPGDAIDHILHPQLFAVADPSRNAPLEAVITNAEKASGTSVIRLRLANEEVRVHEAVLECDHCERAWVDPSTGAVHDVRDTRETTRGFLHDLHRRMLLGHAGEKMTGVAGISLLLISITGIVLWFPRRFSRRAFTVERKRGWRRFNYDLHRVGGIFVALFLVVSAFTGIYFIFHQPFDAVVAALHSIEPRPPVTVAPTDVRIPLDRAVAAAAARFPGSAATWLYLPARAEAPLVIRLRQAEESHPNGRTFVSVDAYRGTIVDVRDALRSPAGRRFLDTLYPLHIGRLGGMPHQILLAFVGVAPLFLFVTGLVCWWHRSLRAAVQRRRQPAADAGEREVRGREILPTHN